MTNTKTQAISNIAYYSIITFIAFCLIVASKHIGMINQNDFGRAIGFMLSLPTDHLPGNYVAPSGFIWSFRPDFTGSRIGGNTSSFIFSLAGIIQKSYSDTFSLYSLALTAKIFLLLLCHIIAKRVAELLNLNVIGKLAVFIALALTTFYAHNVAILNSFYQEYAFFLFLPLLLLCTLPQGPKTKVALCCVAAFFCGAAKTQYFYVPFLFLIVMFANSIAERKKMDKRLIVWLLVVQVLCLLPVAKNGAAKFNYYHSTFLGSYLVMSQEQLKQAGVDESSLSCIGVDAWNNQLSGPAGTTVTPGKPTCFGKKEISLRDVLIPYIKFPDTAIKLWNWAMPEHFTVNYFHVSKDIPYLIPTNGNSYESGQYLIAATEARDKLVSPAFGFILALGLILPLIGLRSTKNPFRATSIFLVALVVSQIAISFLGEGVRDLSKHLWAAQYCLDILVLVCIAQLALMLRRKAST